MQVTTRSSLTAQTASKKAVWAARLYSQCHVVIATHVIVAIQILFDTAYYLYSILYSILFKYLYSILFDTAYYLYSILYSILFKYLYSILFDSLIF